MLWAAVHSALAAVHIELETELSRDHDLASKRGKRLAYDLLILVGTISLGRVEERNPMS